MIDRARMRIFISSPSNKTRLYDLASNDSRRELGEQHLVGIALGSDAASDS